MCAKTIGLEHQKDARGKRVMLKCAKPRKVIAGGDLLGREIVWWEDPVELETVYRYCAVDVLVERDACKQLPELSEREHRVWTLDQMINDRGLEIDRSLCQGALSIVRSKQDELAFELKLLTGCQVDAPTKVEELKIWLAGEGVPTETLGAGDVERLLAIELPEHVRRVLEIRQQAGKSSTAKYEQLLSRSQSGRMRGNLRYYGAATGRWSGSGAQIQNVPRGSISDVETLSSLMQDGSREMVELFFGDPIEAAKSALRSAIVAPEGKLLLVWDFAQIEARVLAWLAKEKSLVKLFAEGKDVYKAFATKVYGKPESEITKAERFISKTCIAEGTLVLCDCGWKPIQSVSLGDRVWDGVEWVCHKGLINNGTKKTLNVCGSYLTPDHLIWSGTQWLEAQSLVQDESILSQALAHAAENVPSQAMSVVREGESQPLLSNATVTEESTWLTTTISKHSSQPVAWCVQTQPPQNSDIGFTQTRCLTTTTEQDFSIDCRQRFNDATGNPADTLSITGLAESAYAMSGAVTGQLSSATYSNYQGGTTHPWKWTGSITTKVTNRGIFVSAIAKKTWRTGEGSKTCSKNSTVYDIACAGPRSRFTILTDSGPLVVHNCVLGLGFQMGATKFKATLAGYGVEVSEAFAMRAVETYRDTFRNIVRLWHSVERDAVNAVGDWRREDGYLKYRLPSGRDICYFGADVKEKEGRTRLTYKSTLGASVVTEETYGGKLVENIVQGIARDVLVDGMFALEEAGIPIVATVHDEIIAESECDRLEEGIALLTKEQAWRKGLPLAVEGFVCRRYRK